MTSLPLRQLSIKTRMEGFISYLPRFATQVSVVVMCKKRLLKELVLFSLKRCWVTVVDHLILGAHCKQPVLVRACGGVQRDVLVRLGTLSRRVVITSLRAGSSRRWYIVPLVRRLSISESDWDVISAERLVLLLVFILLRTLSLLLTTRRFNVRCSTCCFTWVLIVDFLHLRSFCD